MLEIKHMHVYAHGPLGLNMSVLVEDISSIMKSSITLPISVSLLCDHATNDMNGFRVAWIREANKGCSCIATNLGSHRAQTQWT